MKTKSHLILIWLFFLILSCVSSQAKKKTKKILPVKIACDTIAKVGAPPSTDLPSVLWTGSEMLVWGGLPEMLADRSQTRGATYNPRSHAWRSITNANAPHSRIGHTAVWTGGEFIIFGGESIDGRERKYNNGGIFDPRISSWITMTSDNAPSPRRNHTAIWWPQGKKMIVWGGTGDTDLFGDGGLYDPTENKWTIIEGKSLKFSENKSKDRKIEDDADAEISDKELEDVDFDSKSSAQDNDKKNDAEKEDSAQKAPPEQDITPPAETTNDFTDAPAPRSDHSMIWTGSKVIVWGGVGANGPLGDGGIYDPQSNTWQKISQTNAPSARYGHSAIWTGDKMVIWGGFNQEDYVNTGSIYDPENDSWTELPTKNAPTARTLHSAVWTGSKMIILGGLTSDIKKRALNDGGIFFLKLNKWKKLKILGDLSPRYLHSSIWTGKAILVWGGKDSENKLVSDPGIIIPMDLKGRKEYMARWKANQNKKEKMTQKKEKEKADKKKSAPDEKASDSVTDDSEKKDLPPSESTPDEQKEESQEKSEVPAKDK